MQPGTIVRRWLQYTKQTSWSWEMGFSWRAVKRYVANKTGGIFYLSILWCFYLKGTEWNENIIIQRFFLQKVKLNYVRNRSVAIHLEMWMPSSAFMSDKSSWMWEILVLLVKRYVSSAVHDTERSLNSDHWVLLKIFLRLSFGWMSVLCAMQHNIDFFKVVEIATV